MSQVVVYKGEHKGTVGLLKKKKTGKYELTVQDNAILVIDPHLCQYKKKVQTMTSKWDKPSDSQYKIVDTRDERAARNESRRNESLALSIMVSYVTNKFVNMQVSIPTKRGFIGLVNGSVIDTAFSCTFMSTAITNAANVGMLGGGGIDGAIGDAGGNALYEARMSLPEDSNGNRGRVGGAIRTISGNIPSNWIIHAVGPNFNCYNDFTPAYVKLFEAYWNTLKQDCDFIGLCFISSGIFSGRANMDTIIGIAFLAAHAYMQKNVNFKIAVFAAFSPTEQSVAMRIAKKLKEYKNKKNKMIEYLYRLGIPYMVQYMYHLACETGDIV